MSTMTLLTLTQIIERNEQRKLIPNVHYSVKGTAQNPL
jgi:hypothetical protein